MDGTVPGLGAADRRRVEELVSAAREAAAERLVVSTSGNASVRLDPERMAISAARTRLATLRPQEVLVLRVADGAVSGPVADPDASGEALRPSRETPLHLAVHQWSAESGCVFHVQSEAATLLACADASLPDLALIPEVPAYVGRVAEVSWRLPGSAELAAEVAAAFEDPEVSVVQLRNHGQVVRGPDPSAAVERATFHELACRLVVLARGGRELPLRRLSPEARETLLGYREGRGPEAGPVS